MIIIDAHAHLGPFPEFQYRPGEELIADMDRTNIDQAVVMGFGDEPGPESALGNMLDEVAQYPNRLLPLARMDPRYGSEAERRFRHVLEHGEVLGLKLHPISNLSNPFNAQSLALIRIAAEYGLPTLVHSGSEAICHPEAIGEAAKALPNAPIIMGHMGGYFHCADAIQVAEKHRNIYLETSTMPYPDWIQDAIERIGTERIIFGSDQPAGDPVVELKKIESLDLTNASKALILGGNISRLLKLSHA